MASLPDSQNTVEWFSRVVVQLAGWHRQPTVGLNTFTPSASGLYAISAAPTSSHAALTAACSGPRLQQLGDVSEPQQMLPRKAIPTVS